MASVHVALVNLAVSGGDPGVLASGSLCKRPTNGETLDSSADTPSATQGGRISTITGRAGQVWRIVVPSGGTSPYVAFNRRWTGSALGAHTATTVQDTFAPWATNQFANWSIQFLTGARAGQTRVVTGNTVDTITFNALTGAPSDGDTFVLMETANAATGFLLLPGGVYEFRVSSTGDGLMVKD